MEILVTIIVFIVIFSILVLIHELGHFTMAKRAGIKVEEFGFGLPPRLWGKKKGETIYSINWIPFGGFVRMFGEDSSDPKMLRSKRSFAGQPMRARVLVIIAGVVMNFLLAWFLLFVGFTVGMEPLLGPDDILPAIGDGQIVLQPGLKVKAVESGALAEQVGIKPEDVVYGIDGKEIDSYFDSDSAGLYNLVRDGGVVNFNISEDQLEDLSQGNGLGIQYYDYSSFPRVKFFDLKKHTDFYKAGLRSGDTVISVNGSQVFNVEQYEDLVRGVSTLEYEVFRDGLMNTIIVERDESRQVLISRVIPESPAEKAGLIEEDIVLSVNGTDINDSLELIKFVEAHSTENLAYLISRNGQQMFYEITPEDGKIGVFLSELMSYGADQGVSVYNTDFVSSVVEIKKEQYSWYVSVYKSLGETYRLSKMTVGMFGSFISGMLFDGEIDKSVAGPVGIAQMTHVFVKEGFIPILRFMAILSLSLAVINILPFPALDGGRLLFIIIELFLGRPVKQKWEAWIHLMGYVLILMLIVVVTYSDIVRLIGS